MNALRLKSPTQIFFLLLATGFILSMMTTAYVRSAGRKSIVGAGDAFNGSTSIFDQLEEQADRGSRLQLQDFHRVEVKEGVPVWEVKAKRATYYAAERVTHVNDAAVTIYRSADSSVTIESRAAKLYMEGDGLTKAELEGNVAVQLDDSIKMRTDLAIYDSNSREITAPGAVTIEGKGFEVRGRGLDMAIDNQIVKLSDDVYSYFESRAEIPSGVGFAKSS